MNKRHATRAFRRTLLERHVARLDRRLELFAAEDRRFAWIRLGAFLGGGLLILLAYLAGSGAWVLGALLVAVALFSVAVFFHRRLDRMRLRFQLARELTAGQLARLELDWANMPTYHESPDAPQSQHPFALDLTLTGPGSLHRLLDSALSQGGSARLRAWLLQTSLDPAATTLRQQLVNELTPRAGFRRRLALASALVSQKDKRTRWDGEGLLFWLQRPSPMAGLRRTLLVLAGFAGLNILLFSLWIIGWLQPWFIGGLVIYGYLFFFNFRRLEDLFTDAQLLTLSLERFRAVLSVLSAYPYPRDSRLAALCRPFWAASPSPERLLRRSAGIASAASLQHNQFLWFLINVVVPWDFYFAYRLEKLKQELQTTLPDWLKRWYELEALNSLANFAYLNPEYTFPELLPFPDYEAGSVRPVFHAQGLGHPLLPHEQRVCNDFQIANLGELALITGSNMSGKSTFLRTLGVNQILAMTGGPVCADQLSLAPFRLFTCIQVADSLADGISYFYAEVRRLKALLTALRQSDPYPLFFLIDEIFRGTNNREREQGSRAYVSALVGGFGAGVISTHDLELTNLADIFPQARNLHFREDISAERMVFDYKLRPGPSPTTNALKIMALEGLPVTVK
ncbi:MAG TPA: hypothetical protein VLS48_08700 [Anaerolineales bacterium]|nr:hypothetical protein [Anaerolineales bacterium]